MYLYLNIFILLLIIIIFYLKQKSIKEHFGLGRRNPTYKKLKHINNVKGGPNWNYRNKTLTYNPYFKPNRTLKSMINTLIGKLSAALPILPKSLKENHEI